MGKNNSFRVPCVKILMTLLPLVLLLSHSVISLRINTYGGYEDVVVSVGDDVPPIMCQQLFTNIQKVFISASDYLHAATDGSAFFSRVVVVLPASWDSSACGSLFPKSYTSASSADKASFLIGTEHPIFGNAPFTQQSKGCGSSGDFISIGYRYFLPDNDTIDNMSVLPERAIVHEWTKYRYGVFEEVGFDNDPIYPSSYIDRRSSEVKPTYCSNAELSGTWSEDCKNGVGEHCAFKVIPKNNENVTSSIMSVPHLPHVRSYCDSYNHNSLAPTKHNFLCLGESVTNIMHLHPDFRNRSSTSSRPSRRIEPAFVVKQLTQPRFVLLIEETANMNLRDVWKYLKLAVRKFIKYDLETGTQVGLIAVNTDSVRILANMTTLDDNVRGTLAEKLPNYPSSIKNDLSGLPLRKGILQAINMLKWNGGKVGGSVIILISQGTLSKMDVDASVQLLKQEEVAIATIEYPSSGDGKVATLSKGTNSPFYSVRETGVGPLSYLSTYIQLINAMGSIQRHFTSRTSTRIPTLVHQEEFRGEGRGFVKSSFNFDASQPAGQFHIYIPNPIDPKVNKVELTSPSGRKYTDQLSYLHDINVIKIDAAIDQPGLWQYSIERLGDSHQSHFVQVVTAGSRNAEALSVSVFSNNDDTRTVELNQHPLILYADVKKGTSPVLEADVEAFISCGDVTWNITLLDSGNGDPDLTRGDGIYSRYILPPATIRVGILEITVKVSTSPYHSKYIGLDSQVSVKNENKPCCGSNLVSKESNLSLKTMPYDERVVSSYFVKVSNIIPSNVLPPSRVGDLKVIQSVDKNITFQFTAPGDDFDQGKVETYEFYYNTSSTHNPVPLSKIPAMSPAGSIVEITLPFDAYNYYYVWMLAVDSYTMYSVSNIVGVAVSSPLLEAGNGNSHLLAGNATSAGSTPAGGRKMSTGEIAGTVVGVVAFVVLVVGLVICICCRRRKSKKEVSSTETKVYTISEVKEPIHWSASELLQEHEKRRSMYGQTQTTRTDNQINNSHDQEHRSQRQSQSTFKNTSPGSSTRSFRSINEGQYRASFEGSRRPTLTDYESCSSDPILKGPVDYDTAVDSDTDNLNYRTIDSYVGATYRANMNLERGSRGSTGFGESSAGVARMGQQTQVQYNYNSNYQGSLTSVNSKRRNITMV